MGQKKNRTWPPRSARREALFQNAGICCVCREKDALVIHHINYDPSDHRIKNLAPVCSECRGKVDPKGNRGSDIPQETVKFLKEAWELECSQENKDVFKNLPSDIFERCVDTSVVDTLLKVVQKVLKRYEYAQSDTPRRKLLSAKYLLEEALMVSKNPDIYSTLGNLDHYLGNWERARKRFKQALNKHVSDERKRLECLLSLGGMDFNLGNYVTANKMFYEISKSEKEIDLQLRANHYLAWMRMYRGEYCQSIKEFQQILKKIPIVGDPLFEASVYHFSGRSYYGMGRPEDAIKLLKRALIIEEKEGASLMRIGHELRWISECHLNLRRVDSGEGFLKDAERAFQKTKDQGGEAHIGLHQARLNLNLNPKKPGPAKDSLRKSLIVWEGMRYKKGVADCRYLLGIIHEQERAYVQAIRHYSSAMKNYQELNFPTDLIKASIALKRLEERIKGSSRYKTLLKEAKEEWGSCQ